MKFAMHTRTFIKMMNEETVKIGRHYQTPLSFRSKEAPFPNNRRLAESRLVGIKRRMLRDKKFAMLCKVSWKNFFLKDMQENQQSHPMMARSGIFLIMAFTTQVNQKPKGGT